MGTIENVNYIKFIETGLLENISINDKVQTIISKFGPPLTVQGNKKGGFLIFNPLRLGYDANGDITEIGIYFVGYDDILIKIELLDFEEEHYLSNKTLLHEFLYILNRLGFSWKSEGGKPGYGVQVVINNSTRAIFDDYGLLYKLSSPVITG